MAFETLSDLFLRMKTLTHAMHSILAITKTHNPYSISNVQENLKIVLPCVGVGDREWDTATAMLSLITKEKGFRLQSRFLSRLVPPTATQRLTLTVSHEFISTSLTVTIVIFFFYIKFAV